MIAFKVSINGKEKFTTGVDDWDSLHAVIMALRADTNDEDHTISLKIGGVAQNSEPDKLGSVRWPHLDIEIGDEVSISLVEVDIADEPLRRFRSDKPMLEKSLIDEELFELQKQDYLRLKELFKNEEFA